MSDDSRLLPKESEDTFDLTPLIDIVFILLIFFLVATTLRTQEQSLNLSLPVASPAEQPEQTPTRAVLSIDRDGSIFLDNELVALEELGPRLRERSIDQVLLRGDGAADYQTIIDVVDQCHQANIVAVGLATLQRKTR